MDPRASLDYCSRLVREHRPYTYYASLYIPAVSRDAVHALVALDIEFFHIRDVAREELIAHMRYAWWQEALEQTYVGSPPAGHPVLEAWQQSGFGLPLTSVLELLGHYRAHYPAIPSDASIILDGYVNQMLTPQPQALAGWKKAHSIIGLHRGQYGDARRGWLCVKLLWQGRSKAA